MTRSGRVQISWYDKKTEQRGQFDERADYGGYGGSVRYDEEEHCWDPFIWSDGNYACDCNRSLFFLKGDERECSEENLVIESLSVWPDDGGPVELTDYWETV